ncbi:MAG: hypothetical protein JWP81_2149 [Ferruginibacter sp.]|nr:hypothetical protein [Ferruginibacter sp.]
MYHDLSKGEKKIARAAIDKGLETEFKLGMEKFETILKDWRAGKFESNKDAYHKLFKAISDKDKAIGRRYDGLTGGRYLITVAGIYKDGYISEEDIEGFSEHTKAIIQFWLEQ